MADTSFFPRKIQNAFSRAAVPESVKAMLTIPGNPEYVSWWDDFFGDGLDARYAASVGTGTQVVGITAAVGGTMTLTTDTNASDSAGVGLGLHWNGDRGAYFAARLKVDNIATQKFEIGFTDDISSTDEATGAVNTKATPTFAATDCAVFVYDTSDDTNLTFVSNGGTTDASADSSYAVGNDTYFIVEILVVGDFATGYVNGQRAGSGNIEGGNAISPWAFVMTRTGAARTLTVDWWLTVGPRA